MNTVLANAEAESRIPGSVYDVLYLENEAGYIIENLNPTTDGMYFAWDEEKNQMIYLMADLETVYYPEDYTLVPSKCWITAGSAEEAEIIGNKGYNIALEKDIDEEIVLTNVVSIDTLGFKCSSVTMKDGDYNVTAARIIGTFGTTDITSSATSVTTSGTCTNLSVSGGAAVTVGGYVSALSATSATVASTGMVSSVTSASSIVNNGVISNTGSVASSSISGSGKTGANATVDNVVEVGSKEDIESVRNQVASGLRNFKDETIKLSQDVNLNDIAFMPISNYSRDNRNTTSVTDTWFQGTFDGNGYTIKNFSNEGFSITGLNAGTNDSSARFGASKIEYKEAVYGLFGTAYNATFKNLNVTCDIDMTLDSNNQYVGDSVGGIVGFGYGDKIEFVNCTVSGTINGYDGVAAFIGRCYAKNLVFDGCTNNANVTGVRKTAAFCGSISGCTITFKNNCVNNGTITCLGIAKDVELEVWNVSDGVATTQVILDLTKNEPDTDSTGYYNAAVVACCAGGMRNTTSVENLTNNGKVICGGVEATLAGADGGYYLYH